MIGISVDPPERNLAWTKQLGRRVTFIVDRARRIRFVEAGGLAIETGRTLEALGKLARAS